MKNTIIWIIISALALLLGFQIGRIVSDRQCERRIDEIVNIYAAEEDTGRQTAYDGTILNCENVKIIDAEGRHVDIALLGAPRNVCARLSATGCRSCIDTLTEALGHFADANPDWHINLLIDNILLRDMYVLSKEFGPSFSLYQADGVSVDLGGKDSPVVFRVSPEGRVFRHFSCSPDAPERTAEYVATIAL